MYHRMLRMFGIGKKDEHGRQVRIEARGKYIRASRTGGVAVRAQEKIGPANVTVNSSKGLRVSTRITKGTRVAFQNGWFHLIGRWRAGPLAFNLSKTGVSASVRNRAGAFNLVKPRYSSFKFAGVQVRGRKAMYLQMGYILFMAAIRLLGLLARLSIFVFWLLALPLLFVRDLAVGFAKGARDARSEAHD